MLTITSDALKAIHDHGEASYPNEGVGLLLGTVADGHNTASAAMGLANTWAADEQFHRYQVTAEAAQWRDRKAALPFEKPRSPFQANQQ